MGTASAQVSGDVQLPWLMDVHSFEASGADMEEEGRLGMHLSLGKCDWIAMNGYIEERKIGWLQLVRGALSSPSRLGAGRGE